MLPESDFPSTLNALTRGLEFRRYRLLEQIGTGGQGVVWSAVERDRDQIVAVKFSAPPESDRRQADDLQFEREVDRLLSLNHAHILPIYDHGVENQIRFLVSPYVSAGTLLQRLQGRPLPPADSLRIASQVASALDYLHSQSVIHRDLKAPNIMLDLSQHSYLTDFGLARVLSDTTQAVHTGRGTLPYAPPEQHQQAGVTPQSDIYSFGILLYELFTGELPWNGARALGLLQLYSSDELPDPLERNPNLPPAITAVLRRATAADPARRPASAGELVRAIRQAFQISGNPPPAAVAFEEQLVQGREAAVLIKQGLAQWTLADGRSRLALTHFALIDCNLRKADRELTADHNRFMLFHALIFGYHADYWWSKVADPRQRLLICSALLEKRDATLTEQALGQLSRDPHIIALREEIPASAVVALLELAATTTSTNLRARLMAGLRHVLPAPDRWGGSTPGAQQSELLAGMAIEDSDLGDEAARLIGRLRSLPALEALLRRVPSGRRIPVLLEIFAAARGLPATVNRGLRLRVALAWIARRLSAQPAQLIGAYALALAGAVLGIGFQIYATYRLPEFLDAARLTAALEQGLMVGSIFGLGIFLARLPVERLSELHAAPRLLAGALAGTAAISSALFVYHGLFLHTPPAGPLIAVGSALIALGFAVGGVLHRRGFRLLCSTTAVFLAITGTWSIHRRLADSPAALTPLFPYDYDWTLLQVWSTAFVVALLIGSLGSAAGLEPDPA